MVRSYRIMCCSIVYALSMWFYPHAPQSIYPNWWCLHFGYSLTAGGYVISGVVFSREYAIFVILFFFIGLKTLSTGDNMPMKSCQIWTSCSAWFATFAIPLSEPPLLFPHASCFSQLQNRRPTLRLPVGSRPQVLHTSSIWGWGCLYGKYWIMLKCLYREIHLHRTNRFLYIRHLRFPRHLYRAHGLEVIKQGYYLGKAP